MAQEVAATSQVVMGMPFWIATALFLLAYGLIVTEKIHKTIVAIFGAALMIVLKIVTQEDAFHSLELGIDWNVIFLLVSMMIIINIMRPTGVFEYIAIKSAKVAKGEPFKIMAILSVVTAVVSAFLDNVTTVLLIAPVTFLICQALELDVVPSHNRSPGIEYWRHGYTDWRSAEHHDCLKGPIGLHGFCLPPYTGNHTRTHCIYNIHKVHIWQEDACKRGVTAKNYGHERKRGD